MFVRSFDTNTVKKLSRDDAGIAALLEHLKDDVRVGDVFPAVRLDELHFYHAGGCLYKLTKTKLERNTAYDKEKYSRCTEGHDAYEKAKIQNKNRFTKKSGTDAERKWVCDLSARNSLCSGKKPVVVLDIEINLNGEIHGGEKCDMILLHTEDRKIMFVEAKMFSDNRVNVKVGTPEVVKQVKDYSEAIQAQPDEIIKQYGEHIQIINEIFETAYDPKIDFIDTTAKLLVYETPEYPNKNGRDSMEKILGASGLDRKDVAWCKKGEKPTPEEIFNALTGKPNLEKFRVEPIGTAGA